jgi:hypothetical protein
MVRHFDLRFAYSRTLQNDDCVIWASLSSGRIGNGGNKDSCRKDEQTIDFRRAYFNAIMMPVHVDTASASAVAAKNIFVGSELGGGVDGDACVGFGISSFGPSGFAHETWSNWMEQLSGSKVKRPLLMQL